MAKFLLEPGINGATTSHKICWNLHPSVLEPDAPSHRGRFFAGTCYFFLLHLFFWILLPVILMGLDAPPHCRRAFGLEPASIFAGTCYIFCYIDFFIWW